MLRHTISKTKNYEKFNKAGLSLTQARRQDFAAGVAKTHEEGAHF